MASKFSHIAVSEGVTYKVKTLCGKYLSQYSLGAIYTEGYEPTAWTRAPLCPKCAALKVIADSAVVA
jgi:hypothetical protein